jgi:hypothetical protein
VRSDTADATGVMITGFTPVATTETTDSPSP